MLSTVITRKILNKTRNYPSKIVSMDSKKLETLGDFVKRIRFEKNLTTTEVESRSRRGGKTGISNGYITQIENDPSINPSWKKLQALALGLGISETELMNVAGGKANTEDFTGKFELLSLKFGELKGEKKLKAEVLIDVLERELERLTNEN